MTKNKKRHIIIKILIGIYIVVRTILVMYAVLFTLAATFLLVKGYIYFNDKVMAPLNEVRQLKTQNPGESAYMTQYR